LGAAAQRVALVTGASRGIGAEIARQLAADHGLRVLAGARDPGDVTPQEGVVPVQLDVADDASVGALRERVDADPGRLDVLVNNAGVGASYSDSAAEIPLDEVRDTLDVNLFGPWRLVQALLPLLRRSGDARIVNVSSGAGQLADMNGGYPGYRVSKVALNALTRILANEEPEVRTNSLCPGWVRTDMGGPGAARSVAEGADTAVWLATDAGVGSGGFYRDRKPIPW
jgi:NAD(P)-dependent dehydrogenase (short-subunit alcohol dehydrogenase family)